MSADQLALPVARPLADPRHAAILRYAVGVTIATAVALGVAWPLSYLTPVLTATFLAPPGRPVPLKVGVGFVLTVAAACLFALVFSAALLPYPVAYTLLIGWLLAVMFFARASGAPPVLILWMLIAMMIIPVLMLESADLAGFIAGQLVFGSAAAILFVWLAHGLVPAPPDPPSPATPTAATETITPSTREHVRDAATSTLVVFPVVMLFTFFQLTEHLLVLIFIALLGQQIRLGAGRQAGYAMIVANVAGGIVSIAFYNLLVAVPWLPFLLVLTLLCGLLFGSLLFSEHKYAKLAGSAFTTVLLIIGSTTTSTSEAGGKVVTRVLQIIAAVLYLVVALNLVDKLGRRRRS
ncbi:MAG: DUF2955 domain-containing protein [Gemmatimonadetes bacterium]|nr:DUF2955 domain-containing protein [Gemmatimonadota bacterium]